MEVVFSQHAIERYVERVKPCLTYDQACDELERLAEHFTFSDTGPAWRPPDWPGNEQGWAYLTEQITFPLQGGHDGQFYAATCLVHGGISEIRREERNAHKALRRQRRAQRRRESERRRSSA